MTKKYINIVIALGFILVALIVYLIFRSPKTEKMEITHDMVVQQVEELGKLELLKYNIRDIIEYKKMRSWLPNSKTVLIAVGEVVACVDLTKIKQEDVFVKGDSVSIMLPIPEVCYFKIDHARSRVYDVQYGLFDTHKLVDEAYREAEQQIYEQALKMGIAQESRKSAVKMLTPLFNMLGFKKITIDFKLSESEIESDRQNINLKNLTR